MTIVFLSNYDHNVSIATHSGGGSFLDWELVYIGWMDFSFFLSRIDFRVNFFSIGFHHTTYSEYYSNFQVPIIVLMFEPNVI